ncbi:hypothetical protein HA466_0004740 [Hirschfeldia incana]|nr:hypothetical protein HA466_0004740 [Hirschfeldia incana]
MVKRKQLSDAQQQQQQQPLVEENCKSLIKKLASCKQSIRDRSLRTLLDTWLPEQTSIPDEDMKKLWQGIFYCMWHADKSLYQSQLIDRLSAAVNSLPLPLAVHYFAVFLFTMRREWSRIDRLRLDKFYLLIRRFLRGLFALMDANSWDLDLTRRLMGVLFDGTFRAGDKFQGGGVNYHVASVFIEEVREFLPLRKEVLEVLIGPFVMVLGVVCDKVLVGKIKSNLFDELLMFGRRLVDVKKSGGDEEGVGEDDDVVVLGSIGLCMEFGKRFYEMGSSPDCHQGNRKVIFALHKEFSQLEKDMLSSGVEVSITEASREEEVPELVPVTTETESVSESKEIVANGSSSKKKKKKSLKKCSNSKKKDADAVVNHGEKDESVDETMISDLREEFEKIASEMGPVKDEVASVCEEAQPVVVAKKKDKKRKRESKGVAEQGTTVNRDAAEMSLPGPSSEKSSKRVRFAMKNNLVWKPHCPLPPQDLRLPPSATPRGSALKKGIPAGPVRESPSRKTKKKVKPNPRRGVKTIKNKKVSP